MVAIDSGSTTDTTFNGVTYIADKYYQNGTPNNTSDNISGVAEPAIYKTERYGVFKYEIPVTANGRYTVTLHFAEIYLNSAGLRSFSVAIEGTTYLRDIDLYSLVGHDGAYSFTVEDVQVNDKKVTIETISGVENPTIAALAVYSADGQLDTTQPEPQQPTGKKFVGNITTGGQVRSDFIQYWNQITPENEGKWGSVEGTRNQFNWGPLDRIYEYARQHKIPVKAHTFVWGAQAPNWIGGLSPADQRKEIEEWISAYCTRYPDTAMIDVVNEAVPGHQPAGYAQKAFGNNWIVRVFQLARQYCPNSILILNDYNNIRWQHNEFITLAKSAIPSGYVDAIGLQAHELKDVPASTVKQAIDNLWNQLQVPIYISEYDIGDTNDQNQLKNFQEHFPVFYNHPHVKGITIWGYVVNRTWITGSGLIQDNGTPRPAMTWLMNYIKQNPKQ